MKKSEAIFFREQNVEQAKKLLSMDGIAIDPDFEMERNVRLDRDFTSPLGSDW